MESGERSSPTRSRTRSRAAFLFQHFRSDADKQSIRANALRHGLAAKLHVVLAGEGQNLYSEILESLRSDYAPQCTQEELLVNQIAENYWRFMRARNMESGTFQMGITLNVARLACQRTDTAPAPKFVLFGAAHPNCFAAANVDFPLPEVLELNSAEESINKD